MNTFNNLKELFLALNREETLLSEMFKRRKSIDYKIEYALDLLEGNNNKLDFLLDKAILRQVGNHLEIDDLYLHFFEQVLETNEEINTFYINENLEKVKNNTSYYLEETSEQRKYEYLKSIKSTLRKIGLITLRNVVDLKRNIDSTFKNEPNYKIKKAKLLNLDKKRKDIRTLIDQTELLVKEGNPTFFSNATDEELKQLIVQLKLQLSKCSHNLIEIERQLIDFLNQIQLQGSVVEKLRQLKYLKDQFTLETETDIKQVLSLKNPLLFEARPNYPLKLSVDYLQTDDLAFEMILKVNKSNSSRKKIKEQLAGKISKEHLEAQTVEEPQINLDEMKNNFVAGGNHLFDFVMNYAYGMPMSEEDKITVFCQLVSQFEQEFNLTEDHHQHGHIEYLMVYPK
ncbi:MAG: hypothetical protein JJU23_08700 [Cyclobacteriaceae bacterium]|nr:hypothetical protein [Cyclobacteriaceae bacterium]